MKYSNGVDTTRRHILYFILFRSLGMYLSKGLACIVKSIQDFWNYNRRRRCHYVVSSMAASHRYWVRRPQGSECIQNSKQTNGDLTKSFCLYLSAIRYRGCRSNSMGTWFLSIIRENVNYECENNTLISIVVRQIDGKETGRRLCGKRAHSRVLGNDLYRKAWARLDTHSTRKVQRTRAQMNVWREPASSIATKVQHPSIGRLTY